MGCGLGTRLRSFVFGIVIGDDPSLVATLQKSMEENNKGNNRGDKIKSSGKRKETHGVRSVVATIAQQTLQLCNSADSSPSAMMDMKLHVVRGIAVLECLQSLYSPEELDVMANCPTQRLLQVLREQGGSKAEKEKEKENPKPKPRPKLQPQSQASERREERKRDLSTFQPFLPSLTSSSSSLSSSSLSSSSTPAYMGPLAAALPPLASHF